MIELTNPSNLPDPSEIDYMEEPIVSAEIMVTKDYIGPIMDLCQERRGEYISMEYVEANRALLKYDLPLNEIIYDFFDVLHLNHAQGAMHLLIMNSRAIRDQNS